MIIESVQKIDGKNSIILANKHTSFGGWLESESEKKYIEERIEKDKKQTVLNSSDGMTIFILLPEDEKPAWIHLEQARKEAHSAFKQLKEYQAENLTIVNAGLEKNLLAAFIEGLVLSSYRFKKYLSKKDEFFAFKTLSILDDSFTQAELDQLKSVLDATAFCRDLVNEPLSYLTASKLAEEFVEKGKESGYSTEVFNKKKIESLRMGGLLAVNKGSIDPPTFSILEWKPDKTVNEKPYVLVGKGVVYDTGGLSLKPTHDSMDYMKSDMGGAAAVAAAMAAISACKLPVHVIALIPATDNRPDGNAYVPGDVIEMYDGSTVEVLNTDAEGRMILADALSYAKQYDPELVIELSTLTGAAQMAVGNYAIVGMGNAPAEEMELLKEAGYTTHERVAEFPFWDDFSELLKSDIADQKNIGGKYAGSITAGKFLEKFTDYPFIHLDIAGPSYNKTEDKYRGKGGSGVGVRLLFEFFNQKSKKQV